MVAALLVLAAVVVVTAARSGAPPVAPMVIDEGLTPSSSDESSVFVTCQRTLPDRPTLREGVVPDAVGRVRSADVLECPDLFDRRIVTFVGEVVGDVLRRPGGAWVLVNDDAYALETGPLHAAGDFRGANSGLSVWLPEELAARVTTPGNARWRGDVIEVTGQLLRVDPADGGSLTIRASQLEVVAPAVEVDRPLNRTQAILAGALTVLALGVAAFERRVAATR